MQQKHALIIDDNPNNVGVLGEMLALEGVSYTKVVDPARLEAVLQKLAEVDVIFLDLEMPGTDGYQILGKLQNHPHFSNVPVVAYTVHVSEIQTARNMGFHSFLGKPLDADRFPTQLTQILGGVRVWAAS